MTCIDPLTGPFHFGPKERKMSSWAELDLKDIWKLRLNLFKKALHFVRILNQGINRSGEQILHALKLAYNDSRLRLLIIRTKHG